MAKVFGRYGWIEGFVQQNLQACTPEHVPAYMRTERIPKAWEEQEVFKYGQVIGGRVTVDERRYGEISDRHVRIAFCLSTVCNNILLEKGKLKLAALSGKTLKIMKAKMRLWERDFFEVGAAKNTLKRYSKSASEFMRNSPCYLEVTEAELFNDTASTPYTIGNRPIVHVSKCNCVHDLLISGPMSNYVRSVFIVEQANAEGREELKALQIHKNKFKPHAAIPSPKGPLSQQESNSEQPCSGPHVAHSSINVEEENETSLSDEDEFDINPAMAPKAIEELEEVNVAAQQGGSPIGTAPSPSSSSSYDGQIVNDIVTAIERGEEELGKEDYPPDEYEGEWAEARKRRRRTASNWIGDDSGNTIGEDINRFAVEKFVIRVKIMRTPEETRGIALCPISIDGKCKLAFKDVTPENLEDGSVTIVKQYNDSESLPPEYNLKIIRIGNNVSDNVSVNDVRFFLENSNVPIEIAFGSMSQEEIDATIDATNNDVSDDNVSVTNNATEKTVAIEDEESHMIVADEHPETMDIDETMDANNDDVSDDNVSVPNNAMEKTAAIEDEESHTIVADEESETMDNDETMDANNDDVSDNRNENMAEEKFVIQLQPLAEGKTNRGLKIAQVGEEEGECFICLIEVEKQKIEDGSVTIVKQYNDSESLPPAKKLKVIRIGTVAVNITARSMKNILNENKGPTEIAFGGMTQIEMDAVNECENEESKIADGQPETMENDDVSDDNVSVPNNATEKTVAIEDEESHMIVADEHPETMDIDETMDANNDDVSDDNVSVPNNAMEKTAAIEDEESHTIMADEESETMDNDETLDENMDSIVKETGKQKPNDRDKESIDESGNDETIDEDNDDVSNDNNENSNPRIMENEVQGGEGMTSESSDAPKINNRETSDEDGAVSTNMQLESQNEDSKIPIVDDPKISVDQNSRISIVTNGVPDVSENESVDMLGREPNLERDSFTNATEGNINEGGNRSSSDYEDSMENVALTQQSQIESVTSVLKHHPSKPKVLGDLETENNLDQPPKDPNKPSKYGKESVEASLGVPKRSSKERKTLRFHISPSIVESIQRIVDNNWRKRTVSKDLLLRELIRSGGIDQSIAEAYAGKLVETHSLVRAEKILLEKKVIFLNIFCADNGKWFYWSALGDIFRKPRGVMPPFDGNLIDHSYITEEILNAKWTISDDQISRKLTADEIARYKRAGIVPPKECIPLGTPQHEFGRIESSHKRSHVGKDSFDAEDGNYHAKRPRMSSSSKPLRSDSSPHNVLSDGAFHPAVHKNIVITRLRNKIAAEWDFDVQELRNLIAYYKSGKRFSFISKKLKKPVVAIKKAFFVLNPLPHKQKQLRSLSTSLFPVKILAKIGGLYLEGHNLATISRKLAVDPSLLKQHILHLQHIQRKSFSQNGDFLDNAALNYPLGKRKNNIVPERKERKKVKIRFKQEVVCRDV